MAEIDTSSYPKPPAFPAQKSLLDQAKGYGDIQQQQQQIQSGAINIDKQKLDLINNQFGLMNQELSTLANDPSITKEQAAKRLTTFANTYKFPSNVTNHMLSELNEAKDVPSFAKNAITRGMSIQEKVNNLYGSVEKDTNNQQVQPTVNSPFFGTKPIGAPYQIQNPPSTPTVDNDPNSPTYGQPGYVGPKPPVAPPGVAPLPGGPAIPFPVTRPDSGTTINKTPNTVVQNRYDTAIPSGLPPGVAQATEHAAIASGQTLAAERSKAANFQRDIFPLAQAIPALEKLGTKGTGPGTETINHLKSFVLSNVPGVKESDFGVDQVKNYDKAKKYLTDFVNQTGNSGTNDKLAAAFAGNPSVGISNAAAIDVAKSAMALRRLQQSKYLAFEDSHLRADQASQFFANGVVNYQSPDGKNKTIRISQLDPRAFGVDMMDDKSKKTLLEHLNKNPREKELFDKSAEIAIQHGYLNPGK